MRIEFIYTYEHREQEIASGEINDLSMLESEQSLKEFATAGMEPDELAELIKISCCVYSDDDVTLPEWFMKANGKLWF
jgi:hypothetical protein